MAGRIAYYGNIVKNGLVLALDAAKKDSYPGSGTVWRDVSGNGFNGTLTNGPTFSSTNGGNIVIDGVDDYINGTALSTLLGGSTTFTITIWVNPTNLITGSETSAYKTLIDTTSRHLSLWVGLNGSGQYYGLGGTTNFYTTNFNWENNKWQMVTIIAQTSSGQLIKNNYEVTESILKGASFTQTPSFGNNISTGGSSLQGSYSNILFYNRALISTEVTQNYNALKGRYGL